MVASELHGLHAATACLREGSTAMQPSSGQRKYKDGNPDRNLHNRIELRWDCETAKDCQGIERIAPKSWEIHKLQENIPNCPRIDILWQSVKEKSAIHPKPWQCRHNCLQSWGFWWKCNHVSSHPIGHRIAIDPELSVIPDRSKIDPKITSIDTIKLDCNWIAKLQRIARQLVGLH